VIIAPQLAASAVSPIGTSRHFAAMRNLDAIRDAADIDQAASIKFDF
jgi:hypothetical protein